jgi:hypothetical protein
MFRKALVVLVLGVIAVYAIGAVALGQGGQTSGALFATADGQNVMGQDGKKGAGDKNGFASVTGIKAGSKFCYGLTVRGLAGVLAVNVMRGTQNNGSIVMRLKPPTRASAGSSSGCFRAKSSVVNGLFSNPSKYSWTVLTTDFRSGAITGPMNGD